MKIFTNNQIEIDNKQTGYAVYQKENRTVVYHYATNQEIEMPNTRYALLTQDGRNLFKRHFLDSIKK